MIEAVQPCVLSDEQFEKLQLYISEYTQSIKSELIKIEDFDEWSKSNDFINFADWFLQQKGKPVPKEFACFIRTTP